MFEGFVRQLILGYLGRYVKDIQKEQLKITLWNEEVLLENVELSLEAFDYLRLPFALKQGRVGKLSIKIPWKKLGWDPIVIILEDVFVCASQRDDEEWNAEAVERREFAAKKAKLAAAELAKLSKRVCDNRAGRLFTSYISAKILDNIQVSMRSFHVVYHDMHADSVHTMFGLKFSSLTIMKQNPLSSSGARIRGGQVNKTLEIAGLELYCSTYQEPFDILTVDNVRCKGAKCDSILAPCDVFMTLSVNRSGELDNNSPQHSINARITDLEISLDEVQLQQMFILWDYLCASQLREKYGRYRPWCSPLTKKLDGWQKLWWHYAQESVLSDVRKRLKKTSWRYFGQRLSYRHKYVNSYKAKLYSLQQDQSIDENVLSELEQMEKELDIDDILSYRSAAECKLKEFLINTSVVNTNVNGVGVSLDKSRNDEHLTGKSRGWLNWLSLGMLGAGGTDDSNQFSGVISDEVIKDIYEATEFRPLNTSNVDAAANDEIYFCMIKFSIHRISMLLYSMKHNQEIAQLVLLGSIIECKLWESSATILTSINSGEMLCPCNKKVLLLIKSPPVENKLPESEHPSLKFQIDASPNHDVEFLVKALLEPVEVTYDVDFFLNLLEFLDVFNSFESQHQRILSSLNGIKDANRRLQLKAEYILSTYKKVIWDFRINNILINAPWENEVTGQWNMVLKIGAIVFTSKSEPGNLLLEEEKQAFTLDKLNLVSNSSISMCFQLQDLYDHIEVNIKDLEMMTKMPSHSKPTSILEKFSSSIMFTYCIVPDESILKQLEVCISVSSLYAYFTPSIYGAALGFISHIRTEQLRSLFVNTENMEPCAVTSKRSMVPDFGFCVNAKFESVRLLVDLANDGENSLALSFVFQDLDLRYALASLEECSICLKALIVTASPLRGEGDGYILFSSGNHFPTYYEDQQDIGRGHGNKIDTLSARNLSIEGCFTFYHEYDIHSIEFCSRKFTLWLTDAEMHCYPLVIRLVVEFFENMSAQYISWDVKNSVGSPVYGGDPQEVSGFDFEKFGFSNYLEVGSPEHANIPLEHFPFVTISDRCSFCNLESSLLHNSPDWRKYYNLRDRRIRTQQSSARKGYENVHVHSAIPNSTSEVEALRISNDLGETASTLFDLSVCRISLHFHDSSSIIGTVSLPSSSSSLFVRGDYLEALCSLEGLTLTSTWWTKNPHKFLWGPSLPNLSPIINFRMRQEKRSLSSSHYEIGVSFQHVYCLLPPEYLAIIIGYFSLPDWNSDSNGNPKDQGNENIDAEDESSIVYKFEILDSVLILPVESMELQFLKVDIHQLYCNFVDSCSSDNALEGIPPECWVPAHKLAKRNNCLNIFGRDLFLSFLSFKDDASGCLRLESDALCENITLLAPLSADIWVRLPCENESSSSSPMLTTCVMARLSECQVLVEDDRSFLGVGALLDVINQFSLVPDLSQCFKSDVLQFLQMKGCFNENVLASSTASSIVLTEVRCHINSLLIKFSHSINGSSKPVGKAEIQFTMSATLKDDHVLSSDLSFSSLELLSLPDSVVLARCISPSSTRSVLEVSVWEGKNKIKLYLSFPCLDLWIHLSEWVDIIDSFVSYAGILSKMSTLNTSSKNFSLDRTDTLGNSVVTVSPYSFSDLNCSASENVKQETIDLTVKLENICITFHVPICVQNKACGEYLAAADQRDLSPIVSSDIVDGSDFKYVSVTMRSKSSELLVDGKTTKFKSKMEKWSGTITVSEDKNALSWPLFQIFHVFVEAEISQGMMEQLHVKVELRLDHLKVWLSHHFFYFWHGVTFIIPEAGSSQFPFGGIDFEVKIRKISFLLSDGRWSCSGPLFEILVRNIILRVNSSDNLLESLVTGEVQVNYNNIHKVFWEPFIEPWLFEVNVTRKQEMSLNSSIVTDVHLKSVTQLNLNFTEPLIECVFRTTEMMKDSLGIIEPSDAPENQKMLYSPWKHMNAGRYAPYVLQNLTSLSLVYHVYKGPLDELDVSEMSGGNSVEPGALVPVYVNDTPEEQVFDVWPAHSSDRLNEQKLSGVAHHFISIQLDRTAVPSRPISMDRVGLTYLEADFSKAYNEGGGDSSIDNRSSFVVPVVFDVSVQRYSKLIRLYSTVILSNATSLPLELRFDIPFGVAPMILDPIYPGQELPLPLHLAEAGRIRWRPIGNSYLWSEVYNLANLLSQETKVGFLKSFVCYPTHPNNIPFRCCISVRNISLPEHGRPRNSSNIKNAAYTPVKSGNNLRKQDELNRQCVHHLTLHTPLVVKNYLPKEVSLTIESGRVTNTAFLSEVETFFHNVDPWHDLGLEIHMHGFKPANMKFPRTETFCMMAKFSGTKFTQTEIITSDPLFSNGPLNITVEKMMDALSGVREIYIYVPLLLYNCTGFPFLISDSGNEGNRVSCIIPSSYDISEQEEYQAKDGLSIVSSIYGAHATEPHRMGSFSSRHVISNRNNLTSNKQKFLSTVFVSDHSKKLNEQSSKINFESQHESLYSNNRLSSSRADLSSSNSNFRGYEHGKVGACIYSPVSFSSDNELMVRVGRAQSEHVLEHIPDFLWSSPFLLVPPSGSTTVLVPQSASNSVYMISATSSAVAGPLTGRSTAIIFQPRYIISNACSKDICYKQKGTAQVFRLAVGEHSHLHWIDASRELLVSIRYNEPGWQWSGSFLPDDLGDTQVKMQNYVSGLSSMIQVEVQNADISVRDEKVVGSFRGNSGTILILLSDDDTGYMPYRIDNFSKERLRIFQQKCETFETIVNSYTSCPYAWDEPCYPHRLTVEVPGERVLGSYSLDDVKEYMPIHLQSSSVKPERKLVLSVQADGATKVLRVIDLNFHVLDDEEISPAPHLRERKKREQKQYKVFHYKEKVSIVISHLGISLINIHPQELLFACAKNITVDLLQSLDQQKLSFQVSSLQIDNQLRSSPYPVMLSFDREFKSNSAERKLQRSSEGTFEPVVYVAVSKWRKKDLSLVSFEYISLRVADFRLQLEQGVILSLFDFLRNVTSRFLSRDISSHPLMLDTGVVESTSHAQTSEYQQKASGANINFMNVPVNDRHKHNQSLPSVVPIGAPWQKIYLLARRHRKIYVQSFEISSINITLSFSSAPWILRNGVLTSGESLIHRGLMALADVEGAQVHIKQLTIAHHIASWESIQEIVVRHVSRQLLHEMYKVFGSAGVIGNPMGFARALGLGLRDFLSVPARTIFESPTGLITGMAQGTTSLLSNTVYAISDAATQFSKAAHKGIVAFTYDDQAVFRMEQQHIGGTSHSKGVINEVFEGLTGLLQLPIKGAEKHGLPGVFSGIALGVTGLVAKPAASILQVTGKTAQSIRNRSKLYQMRRQSFRVRFPRPLSREVPLGPYSWEEAVGKSLLAEAGDGQRFKDEIFVTCKALKQAGKFVVITERLIVIVSCPSLVDLGKPEFHGVPADLEWIVEEEIGLEGVMHANIVQGVVHVVGSCPDTLLRQNHQVKRGSGTNVRWKSPSIPLVQTSFELERSEDAESLLMVLLSTIERGKDRGWGFRHLLHRSSIR